MFLKTVLKLLQRYYVKRNPLKNSTCFTDYTKKLFKKFLIRFCLQENIVFKSSC